MSKYGSLFVRRCSLDLPLNTLGVNSLTYIMGSPNTKYLDLTCFCINVNFSYLCAINICLPGAAAPIFRVQSSVVCSK